MTSTMTTQIKRHEQKKREIETERIRADLLRAVSHDIRTPLTSIYGSSSTLLECADVLTDAKKEQLLQGIREDAEWLTNMVGNLISVTKIEDGRLNLQIVDTSVEELMDVVLEKFKRRYPEQEVFLSLPDEFVSIPVDPILIEQVILNILENAMQHAEGMKTIGITVSKWDDKVSFEITDDGCGIPENIRQKLFSEIIEKKNPAAGQKKPIDGKRYNMGLGMYVCSAIIKAHQGEFFVKNLLPKGCSFQFLLKTEGENGK
ncbi:MAG: sensor histidine kinase [Lachnospiraceae bacterium]|nr:sensor histidine kinase [Lachnospiraceae bacterium]